MYLHAGRSLGNVLMIDLVQAEHSTRGAVEFIMVDLERG